MDALKTYFKNYWWKLLIIAFVLFVDLLTKSLIVRIDADGNVVSLSTTIIKGVLVILPTLNDGAGFSVLAGKTLFLIITTIVFLIGLIVFDILFKRKSKLFGVATALIFGGAVGNLIDRITFSKVRDFIYLEFINFPVFNVADIALTLGVIFLAIYVIFLSGKNNVLSQKVNNQNEMRNNVNGNENVATEISTNIDGLKIDKNNENIVKETDNAKDNN